MNAVIRQRIHKTLTKDKERTDDNAIVEGARGAVMPERSVS